MPEATQIALTHRELTEMALQDQRIAEGHWELQISFNVTGTSLAVNGGVSLPTVVVQVAGASLTRVPAPTQVSVDAGSLLIVPAELEVS